MYKYSLFFLALIIFSHASFGQDSAAKNKIYLNKTSGEKIFVPENEFTIDELDRAGWVPLHLRRAQKMKLVGTSTWINTKTKEKIYIPNGEFSNETLVNEIKTS